MSEFMDFTDFILGNPSGGGSRDYSMMDTTRWKFDDVILSNSRNPEEAEPMIALVRLHRDEGGDFFLEDKRCVMPMVTTATLRSFIQGRRNNPYFQELLKIRALGENAGWIGEEENALEALHRAKLFAKRPLACPFWGEAYPEGYKTFLAAMIAGLDRFEGQRKKFPFNPGLFGIRKSEAEIDGRCYEYAVGPESFASEPPPALPSRSGLKNTLTRIRIKIFG